MHDPDRMIRAIAARHHGIVTWEQAARSGLSRSAWDRRHANGTLVRLAPTASRLTGLPVTQRSRILAAVLSQGDRAFASHLAAAHLWGFETDLDRIDVMVPPAPGTGLRPGRRSVPSDIRLHRPVDVLDLRWVLRDGIPCARPARVIVDLGAVAPEATVRDVVAHFLIEGRVSWEAVLRALGRHSRQGHHGVGVLREVVDRWSLGDRPPDSQVEAAVGDLLRREGLPPAVHHHRAVGFELDFAFVDLRVNLEVDGWRFHGTRRAFEANRERDLRLAAAGWIVIRITWLQLRRQVRRVVGQLREVLERRAAA